MTDHDGTLRAPLWTEAYEAAHRAGADRSRHREPEDVPLAQAEGTVLAEALTALSPLPAFDTSAMDGWAVAGPPPWRVVGAVLAGQRHAYLPTGAAVVIATGAEVPEGATAVLRSEHGAESGGLLRPTSPLDPEAGPPPGRDIRRTGEEAPADAPLLGAGTPVTPAVLGLAAACGHDSLRVLPRPTVALLVLGDELLTSGPSREGRVRDALGPQLPGLVRGCGADLLPTATGESHRRVADVLATTRDAVAESYADVVVSTGGTAHGPVDHIHAALTDLGAELLIDTVAVRPGHPMLLAGLPGGRFFVGLPGYPLSAVIGVVTVLRPLLLGLSALPPARPGTARLTAAVTAPAAENRMVPARWTAHDSLEPLPHQGSGMLRGLALADGFALVEPGGAEAGGPARFVALPR